MIKTVIVGFGMGAQVFHLPHLEKSDRYEIVGIVSSRDDLTYPVYATLEEALAESEASLYIIATPSHLHADMTAQCVRAGKDVLIEKPAFVTTEEGLALQTLVASSDSVVSVHQNRRFDGDFLTLQRLLAEGTLGDWRVLTSRFDRFRPHVRDRWKENAGPGAGILLDLGPHLIDQALVLFGEPDAVTADVLLQRDGTQSDDGFDVTFHYGVKRVHLNSNAFIASPFPRFECHGTEGSFVKYGLDPQEESLVNGTFYEGRRTETGALYTPDHADIELTQGAYDRYYEELADGLVARKPVVSIEEALRTSMMIDVIRRSSSERRTIVRSEWA